MKEYSMANFLQIAIFFAVINALVFVSTAVFHEVGHGIMGIIHGCGNIRIIALDFVTGGTYTLMTCPAPINPYMAYASAYFVVLPVSVLFLLLEGFDVRYIGLIMLGGNILSSASDIMRIQPQDHIYYTVAAIGALVILFGEDELAEYIVRNKTPTAVGQYEKQELQDESEEDEEDKDHEDSLENQPSEEENGEKSESDGRTEEEDESGEKEEVQEENTGESR